MDFVRIEISCNIVIELQNILKLTLVHLRFMKIVLTAFICF
ncbi:MAG: hypothetical protein RIT43_631, partial [Bacteroidota bacterium]